MFSPGNDLVLQSGGEIAEIIAVARNPHDQVPILLRVLLSRAESFRGDHIELDMMPVQLEVRTHQVCQPVDSFFALEQLPRELLVQQSAAGAGVVHFGGGFQYGRGAAPGTIEGLVYLRPIFTPLVHLKVQPEIILQGLALGAIVALWMGPPRD